jgi:hypothetical protein
MKRLLVLAAIGFGLSIFAAQAASPAGSSDALGPPCSNITDGDGVYTAAGVVDFTVFLQAPACSFVTYSFFVTDTSGNPLGSSNTPDSGCSADTGGCVHFAIDLGSAGPPTVCVYATTDIHGHVADLAPNASDPTCPPSSPSRSLVKGSSGASGGFN